MTALAASCELAAFGLMIGAVITGMWIARQPRMAWLSPPMTALLLVVVFANLGLMPASSEIAIAGLLSGPLLAAAIFLLLLQADLRGILSVRPGLLLAFLAGCLSVTIGAVGAALTPVIADAIGPLRAEVAGMYAGTYTGGAVNFNTLAASYGVDRSGLVFLGATAVDNVFTTIWILACGFAAARIGNSHATQAQDAVPAPAPAIEPATADSLAIGIALTLVAVWGGEWLGASLPLVHPLLWTTVLALVAAQTPLSGLGRRLEPLAILLLYLFIASLGIDVRFAEFANAALLLGGLVAMVTVILVVHGATMLAIARWTRLDTAGLIIASQAAIGGPPTAIAFAETLGRHDLRLPAVLLGLLGYAIGTWLGLGVTTLAAG